MQITNKVGCRVSDLKTGTSALLKAMLPVLSPLPRCCHVIDNLPGGTVLPPSGKDKSGMCAYTLCWGGMLSMLLVAGPSARSGFQVSRAWVDHGVTAPSVLLQGLWSVLST